MSLYDFDSPPARRPAHSLKWSAFPEDVLPMWVADMDFASPPEVAQALVERFSTGYFPYTMDYPPLREAIIERMARLYQWTVKPEEVVCVPGMVLALNLAARSVGKAGDAILSQTPVYGPFLSVPANNQKFARTVDLSYRATSASTFTYDMDFAAFEAACTKQTSLFYQCNPHNPGGMIATRAELERLAEICLRHKVVICADEIHSDLILDENAKHIPIATLSPEVAQQTITLIAPSKSYNIPGLTCSIAIIPNPQLRASFEQAAMGLGVHTNIAGLIAGNAAYRYGDVWLKAALDYMRANRDYLVDFFARELPMLKTTVPQATYLAYIDCRGLNVPEGMSAQQFFMKEAKVAMNDGTFFGAVGAGFVRLNFACSRATLQDALERMKAAIAKL